MPGRIEVCTGPMFSGKTGWLIRRLKSEEAIGRQIQVFRLADSARWEADTIRSRDGLCWPCTSVDSYLDADDELDEETRVIGLDEVQFFDPAILGLVKVWAIEGRTIYCAGLDTDHRLRPFKTTMRLLAAADHIEKRLSKCAQCGNPATYSWRKSRSDARMLVGGAEEYEPRCRACWEVER